MDDITYREFLTNEETEAFVGKNSPFYIEKWESHSNSTLKGWNWAAMIFGMEWMVYRRMYLEALIYFFVGSLISMAIALLLAVFGIGFEGKLLNDAFRILVGVFGNSLYHKKALRVLHKTTSMSASERMDFLSAKGGVSVVGVIVCLILEFGLAFLLSILSVIR